MLALMSRTSKALPKNFLQNCIEFLEQDKQHTLGKAKPLLQKGLYFPSN